MRLGQQSWIHHTTLFNSPKTSSWRYSRRILFQRIISDSTIKVIHYAANEARQIELKHNPIAIPPLNVEIHTVEKHYPNQKWNV